MEINQGCRKKRRGAVIFDGVLICIKIGSLTHFRRIGLIQFVLSLFLRYIGPSWTFQYKFARKNISKNRVNFWIRMSFYTITSQFTRFQTNTFSQKKLTFGEVCC
jgi:hypothetical protein